MAGAAASLVEEVAAPVAGLRGQRPWPVERITAAVEAVGELWHQNGSWLASADVNPLVVTDDGVVAVDALLLAHE